jgi:D-inositol-3-phosphate glycosyltransferase
MQRILLISDHADPLASPGRGHRGGQNVYVRALAAGLGARGHSVDVATRAEDSRLPAEQPIAAGARVVRVPAGDIGPLPRDRFGEVLDEFSGGVDGLWRAVAGYDLVHSHYWYSGLAGLRLARTYGVPLVHSHMSIGAVRRAAVGRDDPSPAQGGLFAARHEAETTLGQESDAITAYCPSDAALQRELLDTPAHLVHVAPPGVDTAAFRPLDRALTRQHIGVPGGVPVVLFVGRLENRKGLADLAAALPKVRDTYPDVRLLVVGGSPDPADPESAGEVLRRHGVADCADMRGSVANDELVTYYSAADVTVVPSRYEPYGLVAVESLACGTPVVAARVGCLKWLIPDGEVGRIVPPQAPDALAAAIVGVLHSGPGTYRAACRRRVIERFTADQWITAIRRTYTAVLSR